ncbi:MAG: alpha/beta hydrolase fold protein [Cyanobacteria bacterium RYN_339]|nr:alpha/beta hydrolase fold protein [Cyanobacteria bacterium RYN_339]
MAWFRRRREACLPPARHVTVPVDGLLLRASISGSGPPLVLVHGLGTSGRCWTHNLDALSRFATLYVVDLPGFGESDTPDEVLAPDRLADSLMRWCLAMDLQKASFLGHSLGGEVCLWFAARYPTMVDRLIVACSTGWPRMSLAHRLRGLVLDGVREPMHFLPTLFEAYAQAGPLRMLKTIQASRPEALAMEMATISAPTLVVWGGRDPVITLDEARAMAIAIPKARLAIIEEGAHGLIFGAPRRFNRLVCQFLAEAAVTTANR